MRTCSKCEQEKPETEFHKCKSRGDGLQTTCKSCQARYLRVRRTIKRREFTTQDRRHHLKSVYGLSESDYNTMLESQGGHCAICGNVETHPDRDSLAVDHDHATGKVRGLLCNRCNRAIGLLRDDAALLRRAAMYLENSL